MVVAPSTIVADRPLVKPTSIVGGWHGQKWLWLFDSPARSKDCACQAISTSRRAVLMSSVTNWSAVLFLPRLSLLSTNVTAPFLRGTMITTARIASTAILVGCMFCPPQPSHSQAALPRQIQNPAIPLEEVWWEGSYSCAQGQTGLRLKTRASPDGTVDALFEFDPNSARRPIRPLPATIMLRVSNGPSAPYAVSCCQQAHQ